MLNEIKNLMNSVHPESIMIDFENSMISACKRVYPLVPKKDCLFHLTKNIYPKVQYLSQRLIMWESFAADVN